MIRLCMVACAATMVAYSALADDKELRDLCPDRPGKGTSPCTVDGGHFQLEVGVFDATFQRQNGMTTDTYFVSDPTLKYGVTENLEIEANIAPVEIVRTRDATGLHTDTGIGDLFLRTKANLAGNKGGQWSVAVEPFIKIPTARRPIGNGYVEGGALVPLALDLGGGWSLASTPEVDVLHDEDRSGYHAAIINVLGLGYAVSDVIFGVEAWSSSDLDPADSTQQYSLDFDLAWLSDANTQIDAGINLGLNRQTPGVQVYLGVSHRF